MEEIKALSIYTPRYKGYALNMHDMEVCGGDCFEFTQKYLDMYWIQGNSDITGSWNYTKLESRRCKTEDLTIAEIQSNQLYICGPND